jgi:hypothetical protein
VILRCTAKLLEWLGGPAGTLTYVPPCDDDWYANVFSIERRKCLVLMHAGTLYPVVVTDVRKAQLRPLGPYLVSVIEAALAEEQLPGDVLGVLARDSVFLVRTTSRSLLGFLTEIVHECRWAVEAAGGLDEMPTDVLNHRLRRVLHNRDGYHDALGLARQRLEVP